MHSGKGVFLSVFQTTFYGCKQLSNLKQKRIPVNDNIVWCKYSRVIKNLSKSVRFVLLNAPKYLGARILSTRKLYVFSEMYFSQKKTREI